jgi:hypothetical protein
MKVRSAIDFERQTLLVLRTVDYISKYGYVETEPKTAAGKRLVSLPSFLIDMLRLHRTQQTELQLKQGEWCSPPLHIWLPIKMVELVSGNNNGFLGLSIFSDNYM